MKNADVHAAQLTSQPRVRERIEELKAESSAKCSLSPSTFRGPPIRADRASTTEEIVLWPLEEMFRRRVIAFLVDQELLPRDRAEMLLSWRPDRPPGSPKRARTSERSPKRR